MTNCPVCGFPRPGPISPDPATWCLYCGGANYDPANRPPMPLLDLDGMQDETDTRR